MFPWVEENYSLIIVCELKFFSDSQSLFKVRRYSFRHNLAGSGLLSGVEGRKSMTLSCGEAFATKDHSARLLSEIAQQIKKRLKIGHRKKVLKCFILEYVQKTTFYRSVVVGFMDFVNLQQIYSKFVLCFVSFSNLTSSLPFSCISFFHFFSVRNEDNCIHWCMEHIKWNQPFLEAPDWCRTGYSVRFAMCKSRYSCSITFKCSSVYGTYGG